MTQPPFKTLHSYGFGFLGCGEINGEKDQIDWISLDFIGKMSWWWFDQCVWWPILPVSADGGTVATRTSGSSDKFSINLKQTIRFRGGDKNLFTFVKTSSRVRNISCLTVFIDNPSTRTGGTQSNEKNQTHWLKTNVLIFLVLFKTSLRGESHQIFYGRGLSCFRSF